MPQGVQSAVTGAGAAVKKGVQAVQEGPVGQAVGQAATSVGNRASQFLSSVTTPHQAHHHGVELQQPVLPVLVQARQ